MNKLFVHKLFIMCFVVLVSSCHKPTKPVYSSITGSIILNNDLNDPESDPIDFSGVTIALYNLSTLDSSLVRINAQHPNIGVPVTQEVLFDHRMQDPMAKTHSDPTGAFRFDNISPGEYIIAIMKADWSVKYVFSVDTRGKGDVSLMPVTLYPVRVLSGFILNDYIFQRDKCYLIEDNLVMNADVTIEPGSNIYVAEGKSIRFSSGLSTPNAQTDSLWRATSSYGMYETEKVLNLSAHRANSLVFVGDVVSISNGYISFVTDGISVNSSSLYLNKSVVMNSASAVNVAQADVHINRVCFVDIDFTAVSSISASGEFVLENSIIKKASTGISPLTSGTFVIKNNYFTQIGIAIDSSNNTGIIENNSFFDNSRDIKLYQSVTSITRNNFFKSRTQTIAMHYHTSTINNNNFFATDGKYFNLLSNPPSYSAVLNDVDARYNFWKSADFMQYIVDHHSNPECPHTVVVLPKSNVQVINCGVQ